jgi:hypothetical protein
MVYFSLFLPHFTHLFTALSQNKTVLNQKDDSQTVQCCFFSVGIYKFALKWALIISRRIAPG